MLIPAVENAISGSAFRPRDVYRSRKGLTVEIGNTDAEGRLILADAIALADEEQPDLIADMATLTGAARVALGAEIPPFYTDDDGLASALASFAASECDPLWRMPLWRPYRPAARVKVADINNVSSSNFAGSITAALFLRRFVTARRRGCTATSSPGTRAPGRAGPKAANARPPARSTRCWCRAMANPPLPGDARTRSGGRATRCGAGADWSRWEVRSDPAQVRLSADEVRHAPLGHRLDAFLEVLTRPQAGLLRKLVLGRRPDAFSQSRPHGGTRLAITASGAFSAISAASRIAASLT